MMFRGAPASGSRGLARGFTLIELMIVVAVVAILAAIAYPSYNEQVRKSRRAQAKADLVEYSQLAERFHSSNNTYVGLNGIPNVSPREGGTAFYTIGVAPTQSTFVITATPQGTQTRDKCGTLTLNQAGVKGNSAGTRSECW